MDTIRGKGKRPPLVPAVIDYEMRRLSKADLLEIAYHLALRVAGNEAGEDAYLIIHNEYYTLCANQGRRGVNLADAVLL